ncbi:COG3772 Phage-related lysozyme (muraminidase) [uncultured Caudovirales phage]|uniref:Endolysin n=1 Tax=uncultured Caudovirales phage TaxID=2100421 RepID=A0A6J5MZG8_9CAUD|nr:COG3772 Phage-related lysozyme (muraminidase) [uncultured Caudovirales phage]
MKASKNCLELIKSSEGFSAKPYLCPAGIPTIGYGSTRYANGFAVSLKDTPITEQVAGDIMLATLQTYEDAVTRYVTAPLNQNQFDALVDFAYNAGAQNLRTSTLVRKLNAGDYKGAAAEFPRWNMGGGKILTGLVTRRAKERALFERAA